MTQYHNFYDTETTGADPRFDQVLQAAAILTDDDFVELEWLDERSRLAGHMVPSAGALKVTHVDPYDIARAKYSAFEFARMLHGTFDTWGKKGDLAYTGFNTIRFDEEIMRQMFWENLLDPYLSSGKGTSRNDLLGVIRSLYARNPACFEVPKNPETGKNNFKLENVAPLNGFDGHNAHDALGDVRATIFVARMIRDTDPHLWHHMMGMGNAKTATAFVDDQIIFRLLGGPMLDPGILDVCLIASEAANPKNKSAFNLAVDPTPYLDLSAGEILEAMKKPNTPFRTVKCNKQPAAFPIGFEFLQRVSNEVFEPADAATIDLRADMIRGNAGFQSRVAEALRLRTESYDAPETLEEKIYEGFPSWDDKKRMQRFQDAPDWEARMGIVREFEKSELRQLGIRAVYLSAPENLADPIRTACADKIGQERHTLAVNKPWNTVGSLMKELDQMLAADPDDAEALNIRTWALETYSIAHEWTGVAPDEVEIPEGAKDAEVPGSAKADAAPAEVPTETVVDKEGAVPHASPARVEEDAMHFLDGLE